MSFDQKILCLFVALKIQIVTKFAYCICETEQMLLLILDHKPLYTFPLLVAEFCNHEQKTNYLSLKETQKKKYYNPKSFLRLFHEDSYSIIVLPSMKHQY